MAGARRTVTPRGRDGAAAGRPPGKPRRGRAGQKSHPSYHSRSRFDSRRQRIAMSPASAVNLTLRVIMEAGVVAGLVYWGIHTGDSAAGKAALGIGAPVLGFGVWGALDFRRAGRYAEGLRLAEELVISGLAATALYTAGAHVLGAALATVSIVHHILVYAIGERLLKPPLGVTAAERAPHEPTAATRRPPRSVGRPR